MSLDFNFTAMIERVGQERYDEITTSPFSEASSEPKWHPVTNALIWMSLGVDLNKITEDNVDEWWFRVRMLQLTGTGIRTEDGQPDLVGTTEDGRTYAFITREDIANHIGMSTNVTQRTRAAWLSSMFGKDGRGRGLPPLKQKGSAHDAIARMARAAKRKEK